MSRTVPNKCQVFNSYPKSGLEIKGNLSKEKVFFSSHFTTVNIFHYYSTLTDSVFLFCMVKDGLISMHWWELIMYPMWLFMWQCELVSGRLKIVCALFSVWMMLTYDRIVALVIPHCIWMALSFPVWYVTMFGSVQWPMMIWTNRIVASWVSELSVCVLSRVGE